MDTIVWEWLQQPGLDVARVRQHERGGWTVDGHAVFDWDGQPLALRYRLDCDDGWRLREGVVRTELAGTRHHRVLTHDDAGWSADGVARPDLCAAIDIDLMATPMTNTLPIRRAHWAPGTQHDFTMAYIRLPDLVVTPVAQRYTMLAEGRFRYELVPGATYGPSAPGVEDGFTAELEVDAHGFVTHYPPHWRRLPDVQPSSGSPTA